MMGVLHCPHCVTTTHEIRYRNVVSTNAPANNTQWGHSHVGYFNMAVFGVRPAWTEMKAKVPKCHSMALQGLSGRLVDPKLHLEGDAVPYAANGPVKFLGMQIHFPMISLTQIKPCLSLQWGRWFPKPLNSFPRKGQFCRAHLGLWSEW